MPGAGDTYDTQEFTPNSSGFIETTPQISGWNKLHPVGKNHSPIFVRVREQASKIKYVSDLYECLFGHMI